MGRKGYKPEDLDPEILPLVDLLNELEHIETAVSCESHDDRWWSSRTPFVTFFVRVRQTEDGNPLFPAGALSQLGALSWVLTRTCRDGFFPMEDEEHRQKQPLARVIVNGERPGMGLRYPSFSSFRTRAPYHESWRLFEPTGWIFAIDEELLYTIGRKKNESAAEHLSGPR